ncbi:Helix-turn-helix protein [Desulfitobacterium dehalogenans ATCC 51507]|uniref:Helix-turn-helix protein n=1 Tax=Desulfitobacterium dehalogenans (strain ATCC 51507 / DSM 9161 / JW/IU-DC1) TaxID=756499 RepID=I4AEI9_DESDJ|nr:helix-turn-helix transcriptional regulator [Desulfitobacterium dehalogenans]AFM02374.1 Helix-turn-helix protein [Desulfitobacterium dehalogenans ATCC 51507]
MLEKIQSLCKTHKITLTQLERELGFGRGALYKWTKSFPTADNLQKVADFFKVSTDYLLGISPFTNAKEAGCSIRVAGMKAALDSPQNKKLIWDAARINIDSGFWFKDSTRKYIESLLKKEAFTDVEYYDLSLFVVWELILPPDFRENTPVVFVLWGQSITFYLDYWSIPKLTIEDKESKIFYKEGLDDVNGEVSDEYTLSEFTDRPTRYLATERVEEQDALTGSYEPETIAAHHDGEEWTDEELAEIERFKEFVRSKKRDK